MTARRGMRWWAPTLIGAALSLGACSAPSQGAAPQPSSDPAAVEFRVDPASVPDLMEPAPDEVDATWQITGAPAFGAAMRRAIAHEGGRGDSVEAWPVASSSDLMGFRIRATQEGTPVSSTTLWYSLREQRVVANDELVPGLTIDQGLAFTPSGELYLESIVAGTAVAQRGDPAVLTDLGRAARRAALWPLNPVVAAPVDCTAVRCIALTFDDGPSEFTFALLQTLSANRASATFFIRGSSIAGREDVLQTTSMAGHQIGNHSQQHLRLSQQDRATVDQEIAATSAALAGVPANGSPVFRPPYGDYDADVLAAAKAAGYAVIMWNLDPLDYRTTDPRTIASRVVAAARRGSVVLSHDTLPATEEAYRTIVPELRRAGYELVTVDQLLGPGRPGEVHGGF